MATHKHPLRGEVWLVNFDPAIGTEIKKTRPAVVVSNDIANKLLERVQVVPITSNVNNVYPSECVVTVKKTKGKAAADQIMTVSKKRLYKQHGKIAEEEMVLVEQCIMLQLGLTKGRVL